MYYVFKHSLGIISSSNFNVLNVLCVLCGKLIFVYVYVWCLFCLGPDK